MAGSVAVVGLLLLGSVIGSAHTRSADRSVSAPTPTAPEVVVRTGPPVTITATAIVTAQPSNVFDSEEKAIALVAHGTGSGQTVTFRTPETSFEAIYTYDCALLGSRGRFVADLYRNGDDVGPIADTAGRSARGTAPLENGPGTYSVRVTTRCSWTVMIANFSSYGFR